MKKLLMLVIGLLMLSGCATQHNISTFMLTRNDELYALYNDQGEQLTDFIYKTFDEVEGIGYIVTNDKDEKGFISDEGDEVVAFGVYQNLENAGGMLLATEKTEEEIKANNGIYNSHYFVLDSDGEILYTMNQDVGLIKSGLPIIVEKDNYKVLYNDGEVLVQGTDKVVSASLFEETNAIVNFENQSIYYDLDESLNRENNQTVVSEKGNYVFEAVDTVTNQTAILYDSSAKQMLCINRDTNTYYRVAFTLTDAYYDSLNTIVLRNNSAVYLYTPGVDPLRMTSYYMSMITYVGRSNDVYGPHDVYKDGVKTASLENVQLFPSARSINSEIFPVYERKTGYTYYNFDGDKVIDTVYLDAEPFDGNKRAIVKIDDKGYSLIDDAGTVVTSETYTSIKYIGSSYYAVYNNSGTYGVINIDGEMVLELGYTTLPDQAYVEYNDGHYLLLGRNGRSYIYDVDRDLEELFSVEGSLTFNELGYYQMSNHVYYTIDGEIIE